MVMGTNDSHTKAGGHRGWKSKYRQTAVGWFRDRTLAGFLEEAAFEPGIKGCGGFRVRVRTEDRRNNLGKALEMKNTAAAE